MTDRVPYTRAALRRDRYDSGAHCDGCGAYLFLDPGVEAGHTLLDCVKHLRTLIAEIRDLETGCRDDAELRLMLDGRPIPSMGNTQEGERY